MKTGLKILAVALIAGATMFAQPRLSIGVRIGGYAPGYYPPPAYAQQYVPPCPGPGYTWTDGYWAPEDGGNVWIAGFWQAPYNSGYGYGYSPRYVAPPYYNNSYRGYDRYDREDHDRNRGYDNRYQNRGGERRDERHDNRGDNRGNQRNDNRGNGYSNGFRR